MDEIDSRLAGQPVIIGGGLAGLMTALHLAPEPVIVLAKTPPSSGAASAWAQGGVAAALGADDDAALHAADTAMAGDGLCDPSTVLRVTGAAREAIEELARRGVSFDRDPDGGLSLGLEAAHSRRRIVHAQGDSSGREIMRALCEAVRRTPSITVLEGVEARRLLTQDGAVVGVLAMAGSRPLLLSSGRIVIATGGIGGLYRHTTNPLGSVGQGVALAAHAGAELADMEFVQFHPTALDVGLDPMPLVSEAVRGEGATLIDEAGTRIMAAYDRGELEPRDVVARAIWQHLARGHRVFIDARAALGSRFPHRFPGINACCRAAGIDPASMPVPVRPAAHYHMGGIAVDDAGRSFIPGLWACGEAAATGLHGANRLASNSLLEATAYARWVADSVRGTITAVAGRVPAAPVVSPAQPDASAVRPIMTEHVGVLRDRTGLTTAVEALERLAATASTASDAAAVGLIIATAALMRAESRGGHCRTDFPLAASRPRRSRTRLDLANAPSAKVISGWSAVSAGV